MSWASYLIHTKILRKMHVLIAAKIKPAGFLIFVDGSCFVS